MSSKKDCKEIADKLVYKLKQNGFIVQRYDAYSTESVYLKLDYGLVYSIRISTHTGKKHLAYTFNLIKNYTGKRLIKQGNVWRQYYSFAKIDGLVEEILKSREWVKKNYHPNYAESMERFKVEGEHKKGFWQQAVLV